MSVRAGRVSGKAGRFSSGRDGGGRRETGQGGNNGLL